ncbi:FAD:protein FMN transferase [Pelagicoccus albus]|uniref:FAD:protein FMN transferase n=1 Tax=Pelagicoccus albus TaxID=415222 RepID=A0A7X1E916_9BACT|nr:FAD:protein FMN transferase [Pelagicoccus albus]MBC2606891.1 FAD:protein FMN transferase [Pelagicoccus albus]
MLKINRKEGLSEFRHQAMATDLVLSTGGVDRDYASQVAQCFFGRIDEIEKKLSLYLENSDVTRINLLEVGSRTKISTECIECLMLAVQASSVTRQRFHPMLGTLALREKGEVPPYLRHISLSEKEESFDEALEIDPAGRTVLKCREGVLLDLGGIGKGFALDEAMMEIEDWEVPQILANFGGSTLLFKNANRDDPWSGSLDGTELEPFFNGAISSSGLGFQRGHIVSTKDRVVEWKRSYSRCESAGLADALSTAAFLMDEKELAECSSVNSSFDLAVVGENRSWGMDTFRKWIGT